MSKVFRYCFQIFIVFSIIGCSVGTEINVVKLTEFSNNKKISMSKKDRLSIRLRMERFDPIEVVKCPGKQLGFPELHEVVHYEIIKYMIISFKIEKSGDLEIIYGKENKKFLGFLDVH